MNQFVSLLTPGGQSAPANSEPKFPAAAARNRAAAPFSSMLERAEYRAPERPHQNTRPARSNSARSNDSKEEHLSAKTERRPRTREKQKKDESSDEQNLAGTGAVNSQPVKPDDSAAPTETGVESKESTQVVTSQSGSPTAMFPSETSSSLPLLPDGASASTVVPTTATPQTATDLQVVTALPINSTAAAPMTPATDRVTTEAANPISSPLANLSSITKKSEADTIPTPATTETIADAKSSPSAASAREAEVLLTLAPEEKSIATPEPATEELVGATAMTTATPEEARQVARAARRFRAETLENIDGIGGAKSSATMKTAIKKEELAGGTQQLLPGSSATPVSALTNLPGETHRSGTTANSGTEALQAVGKTSPAPVRSDVAGTGESIELRAASPLPRVSELISREVRMFKRGGDDLVEVVLTPDTKTQISLRLQWREGQVEVQARCDFGDYSSLNNQWSQLQTSLANHGVRLSHLSERTTTGFTEFFNNPNFAQHQGRERQPDVPLGRPEGFPATPAPAVKPGVSITPRRSNRLFDSWA